MTDPAPVDLPELLALGVQARHGLRGARLLTDAQLRTLSHGRIQNPETINYRTNKPERDGLFCARVFGPIEDWTCICGKYAGEKHRGVTCEKCGVEILPTSVRTERFGHVELAAPVVHPLGKAWVARLLQLRADQLDDVIAGVAGLDASGRLTPEADVTQIGGHTLRAALAKLDVEALDDAGLAQLGHDLTPAQLMIEVLLVLPPGLRPLEPQANRQMAIGDLNELYRRVINRNNRLCRLIELDAPMIILHNEYRELQLAVEQLMGNESTAKPLQHQRRILRSLESVAAERLAALHRATGLPGTPPSPAQMLAGGAADLPAPPSIRERTRDADEPEYDF